MTNAELQIAIDAIRNATADGSVTNVMEADIFDALKEKQITANSYSTKETLTGGTWIDGKPIYRKTFYQEVISSVLLSTKLFYADISNLDIETILPCKITINKGISTYFSADDFNRDNNSDFQKFNFRVRGTDVEFIGDCLTADLNVKTIVILEYTKTTD